MPPMRPPIFGPPRANLFRNPASFNTRGLFGAPMARGGIPLGASGVPKQGGGFLASLFGKGGGSGIAQGAAGTAAKAAGGGSTLTNFMSSTQKVLAAGERVVPMVRQVQQYGPLIKNLPSMWKIYRGLNSTTAEEEATDDTADQPTESGTIESSSHTNETSHSVQNSIEREDESSEADILSERSESPSHKTKTNMAKASVPKLFI